MIYVMLMSALVSGLVSIGVFLIGRALSRRPVADVRSIEVQNTDHRWMDNILAKSHPPRKPKE